MCNSFVIGDLVIDHTIFVRETTTQHQQFGTESIFEVLRRSDTAGGAANCARILSVLSTGDTYLWGVTGRSQWGHFRAILEHSQAVDGSARDIEFRGVTDETEARMNTVTRLIVTKDKMGRSPFAFGNRFDESRHLHVPPEQRDTALYYLEEVFEKLRSDEEGRLDIIVLSDLDMGCIDERLVQKVADFASRKGIPLFVDPKYDAEKYRRIKGTAILPNLTEWCRLVGEESREREWRTRVKQNNNLCEMAYQSFRYLGDFDYYVIKCDEDGTVFIGPSPVKGDPDHYVVYKVPPHPATKTKPHQLGHGDVLTAAFGLEFQRLMDQQHREQATDTDPQNGGCQQTLVALKALVMANAVVACYRKMDWHRMPDVDSVEEALREVGESRKYDPTAKSFAGKRVDRARKSMLYLPKVDTISLSQYQTVIPGWFSDDTRFAKQLVDLVRDFKSDSSQHIVLGSPAGCGKSTLAEFLGKEAERDQIEFCLAPVVKNTLHATRETTTYAESFLRGPEKPGVRRILAIDEALKRGFRDRDHCLLLLNKAKECSVRLMLIDTGFFTDDFLTDESHVEIKRRVNMHILLAPNQRPHDIPLIIAGLVLQNAPSHVQSVHMRGDFLLALTGALLHDPSVGNWAVQIKTVMQGFNNLSPGRLIELSSEHVPASAQKFLDEYSGRVVRDSKFTFSRA